MDKMKPIQEEPVYTHLILASQSPRRKEILTALGIRFQAADNPWEEVQRPGESPRAQVLRLSREKLTHFLHLHPGPGQPVLGADTLIGFRGQSLGKPRDEDEAWSFYQRLAGTTHAVYTGFALYVPHKNRIFCSYEKTQVRFLAWDQELYHGYLKTEEWKDAAGGYKIQGKGMVLVQSLAGSWTNVVGLPSHRIYGILRQHQCLPPGAGKSPESPGFP